MVTNPHIVFVLYIISFIDLSPWISLFSIDVCIWSSTKAVSHWRQIGKSKIVCKLKNCQQFQSDPGFIFDLCLFLSFPFLSLSLWRLGRPGVDTHVSHEGESACAVILSEFIVNDGRLVTVTADDTIHLWNIRQKVPQVIQSLKFQRER